MEEFEVIRANLLPAAGTITDNDMILIVQGGKPKRALPSAMMGKQGDPGLSAFLGVNDTYVLWKQGASGAWQTLFALEKIRGPKGEKPKFRKVDGTLQMKYEGEPDSAFVNIFDREELKLKFSDLTPAEVDLLRFHFSDFTEENKAELMKPATDAAKDVRDKMDAIIKEAKKVNKDLTDSVNVLKEELSENAENINTQLTTSADLLMKGLLENTEKVNTALTNSVNELKEQASTEITNMRQLEATVEEEEEKRGNSYTQWQAAEQGRQNDELKRKEAEALREAAEELRDTAESTRNAKETDRQAAEVIRQNTEKSRVEEETKRAAAEDIRNQTEQLRSTEEGKRIEEEKKRVAAETLRNQSEINRDKAEKLRDDAETLRAAEEVDRDNAEQERIVEESKRDIAEKARAAAEAERQKKEGERIIEEQLRKTAEVARQENETTRQTQEEQREQGTVQAILNAEEATGKANTATDRANTAAENAENIVKGFQSDWNVADPSDPNYIKNKPEIPTLASAPGADTLSYVNAAGTTVNFRIGDEVRVLEDGEYVFYKLYDLAGGVASWQEAGSGTALPGNIYLQGANYYNDSVIIIKEGYIQ
ncbi:hypothetical protein DWW90_00010 [Parabacteroides sp. AF17-28]|uniref:hypothetical protein n=1 Tax=Parabacteroides sp. AF17-28 TaxID=2292241 RepID=UPI000F002BA1|nr:hypothetical protein [Parabacteroides sp. AF17-28]RHR62655.1 hypothetical protein DWW90_00010 [Parabacteroides sp. AF17-28]